MRRSRLLVSVALFSMAVLAGCGGGSNTILPPGSSAVSLTIGDTPPSGVTVLSFEVSVTGAVLKPGNIDLLAGRGPIKIEVERLQTETAFLSTANVTPNPNNPFTSLDLTFANPELTFQNNSAAAIAGCPNTPPNNVCEIKPMGTLTATVNFAPPGLTINANTPTGLLVDLNLDKIISGTLGVDFSGAGNVTISQLPIPGRPTGELEELEELFGKVANKGTNTFDLQLTQSSITGIQVDSNTKFEDFASCTANPPNFSCVNNGDMVEVELRLMAGGALVATKIEQENEQANEEDLEGILVSTNLASSTFQMVVVEDLSSLANVDVGSPVIVHVQAGATFRVDNDGLSASGFTFGAFTDLLVGQSIQVRRVSGDGSTTTPIETDRVRLRMSRFTAKVKTKIDANTFTVDTSTIGLFNSAGITEITVSTSSQTDFESVASVSALNVGDTVSLRGLLFKQPVGNPVLVAGKVRKR